MAFFDPDTGQLVLQVVYDGAPLSGKTASVESLGRLLNRPVVSPDVRDGRTMLFDWMEYEGGVRYGRPIVCRVISVPGQRSLAQRRVSLLRSADCLIFVADSRAEAFAETLEQWSSLHMLIDRWNLKMPVVVQLNKRDEKSALPVEEMVEKLGPDRFDLHCQSEAVNDKGTRETFVLTVSAAVRTRLARGGLTREFDQYRETQPIRPMTPEELALILGQVDEIEEPGDSITTAEQARQDSLASR